MATCDPNYGCGKETNSLFSVLVYEPDDARADGDGKLIVKVCRDCAASGDWEDE